MNHRSRGFTLIELLVVIAIIGILSAVVLASLNTARSKGNDAAVQSNLNSIRTEAEIFYGDNSNSYGGTAVANCTSGMFSADTTIKNAIASAANAAGGMSKIFCGVGTSPSSYAVAAQLTSNTSWSWCIDSTGYSGTTTVVSSSITACP